MPGLDFLNADTVRILWGELESTLQRHLVRFPGSAARFFQRLHPSWHQIGRVHLQLAENPGDLERPFSFLATYTVMTRGLAANHLYRAMSRCVARWSITPVRSIAKNSRPS